MKVASDLNSGAQPWRLACCQDEPPQTMVVAGKICDLHPCDDERSRIVEAIEVIVVGSALHR